MIETQYIHPILVHFPIVLVLALAALDTIFALRGVPATGRSPAGNLSAGLAVATGAFALAAYIFGDMALEIAEAGGFHDDIAETHEHLGTLVMGVFVAWALFRGILWLRKVKLGGGLAFILPAIEIAGAALVMTTAYYGGMLVYDLGVNVAKAASGG